MEKLTAQNPREKKRCNKFKLMNFENDMNLTQNQLTKIRKEKINIKCYDVTLTGIGFSGHGFRMCSPITKFWSLHTYACAVSIWHVTTLHQSRSLISAKLILTREIRGIRSFYKQKTYSASYRKTKLLACTQLFTKQI